VARRARPARAFMATFIAASGIGALAPLLRYRA
jgi:hypothetical protein